MALIRIPNFTDEQLKAFMARERSNITLESFAWNEASNSLWKPWYVPELNRNFTITTYNRDYTHDDWATVLGFSDLFERSSNPIILLDADTRKYVTIWTESERKAVLAAWSKYIRETAVRAQKISEDGWKLVDMIDGVSPVLDDEGEPLTGEEALNERRRLYYCEFLVIQRGHQTLARTKIADEKYNIPDGTLSSDLDVAKQQLIDEMRNKYDDILELLLVSKDHPTHSTANESQRTAVTKLSETLQEGVRKVLNTSTVENAKSVRSSYIRKLHAVKVADSPLWMNSSGNSALVVAENKHAVSFRTPAGGGAWSYSFSCTNPTGAGKGSNLGDVAVQVLEKSDKFYVTHTTHSSNSYNRSITITQVGEDKPDDGSYKIALLGINKNGSTELSVTVHVSSTSTSD